MIDLSSSKWLLLAAWLPLGACDSNEAGTTAGTAPDPRASGGDGVGDTTAAGDPRVEGSARETNARLAVVGQASDLPADVAALYSDTAVTMTLDETLPNGNPSDTGWSLIVNVRTGNGTTHYTTGFWLSGLATYSLGDDSICTYNIAGGSVTLSGWTETTQSTFYAAMFSGSGTLTLSPWVASCPSRELTFTFTDVEAYNRRKNASGMQELAD